MSASLVVVGSGLAFSSCSRDILRDGSQPIASMIALVGLFAICAGWTGWRMSNEAILESRRVPFCLLFEHVFLCAIFGGWWLVAAKNTFFAGSLLVENLTGTWVVLLGVFATMALLSAFARLTLAPSSSTTPTPLKALLPVGGTTLKTVSITLLVLALLNLERRYETLLVGGRMQITIVSCGIPQAFFQDLRVVRAVEQNPHELDITLPDGTSLRFDERNITKTNSLIIMLPGRAPQQFDATLSDGTSLRFDRGLVSVPLPGARPQQFDVSLAPVTLADRISVRYDKNFFANVGIISVSLPDTPTKQVALKLPDNFSTRFGEGKIAVILPDGAVIEANTITGTAGFVGGGMRRTKTPAALVDGFVALIIVAHLCICSERIRRARATPVRKTKTTVQVNAAG